MGPPPILPLRSWLVSYLYAVLSCFSQPYPARSDDRVQICPATVACPLPDGWQADWRDELLWITHYNPDGTVADALPFDSLKGLYDWVEDHPDFCDVNVERLVAQAPEVLIQHTADEREATALGSGNAGELNRSAKATA